MKKLVTASILLSSLLIPAESEAGRLFNKHSGLGHSSSKGDYSSNSHLQFSLTFDSVADSDYISNGVNTGDSMLKDGVGVRIAYGQNYRPNSRWEVELLSRESDVEPAGASAILSTNAIMVNNYHEFPSSGYIRPYVTAGLGFARYTLEDTATGYDSTQFAYQFGGGVNVPVAPATDIVLGYRYFDSATPVFEIGAFETELDYSSHSLELGLKLNF